MIDEMCFSAALLDGAKEVFETMIFMDIEESPEPEQKIEDDNLLGSITFKGNIEGCLAIRCGVPSRRLLYRMLTAADLAELDALWEIDPWGEERADLRAGIIASAAVAPYCKRGQTPRPLDFMPFANREKKSSARQSQSEMKSEWARAVRNWSGNKRHGDGS